VNANPPGEGCPGEDGTIPRFRAVGDITLDLFHRDGRIDDRWIGLNPSEFALIWRLAQHPGERVTWQQLLAEEWHIQVASETDGEADHVATARAKLATFGMEQLIATHPDGFYYLDLPNGAGERASPDFRRD
jgi:two-component system, OmpR family, response regulator